MLQSRTGDELIWRDEESRCNHFTAYITAQVKARLTGRTYRLLDQDGAVLEQIRLCNSSDQKTEG